LIGLGLLAVATGVTPAAGHGRDEMRHTAVGAAVSFAELKATVAALDAARAATEQYRDVRVAKAFKR
jgi:hypothetical protein